MEITVEYKDGEKYKAVIPAEAMQNTSACLLDDGSVKVWREPDDIR